jgi:hypothetical protein
MTDNLFTILGIQTREDCVSNALAYAVNESASFREEFLKQFCNRDASEYFSIKAYTRISTGTPGIPDIVVTLEKDSTADLIVIENKLKAEEGSDQTDRYCSKEAIGTLMNRLLPEKSLGTASFVFLTLFPDQNPASNQYSVHRHSELKKVSAKVHLWGNEIAKQLIIDWLALVEAFYEKEDVALNDVFHEKLSDDSGLDAGFLYFRQAFRQLELPFGLEFENFFRSSQQGRRYYGAVISKKSWHPSEMEKINGAWMLDPLTNFNIHFEPQYNVLSGTFNCFLHYETNWYEPLEWIRENIPVDQYGAYLKRRSEFSSGLKLMELPGWFFGGGSNQIAKAAFNFSKSTYEDVKKNLELEIWHMSRAIDKLLKQI